MVTYIVSLGWGGYQLSAISIYMDRYLIIILPAFILMVSRGLVVLTKGRKKWLPALVSVVILGAIMSTFHMQHDPTYAREDWDAALDFIAENSTSSSSIIGRGDLQTPLRYYDAGLSYLELPPPEENLVVTPAFDEAMDDRLQVLQTENVQYAWFIEVYYNQNPHNFPGQRNERTLSEKSATRQWLDAHLLSPGHWYFPGIRLTLYNLRADE